MVRDHCLPKIRGRGELGCHLVVYLSLSLGGKGEKSQSRVSLHLFYEYGTRDH